MHKRPRVFVIFDGFQPLDLVGPHEVFRNAGTLSGGYCCQVVARWAGPVPSGSGLPVHATYGLADLDPGAIDTLVVTGGVGVDQARHDPALVSWIAAAYRNRFRSTRECT